MAPYNYGLSLLPILVYKPHPKGITGIRGFLRLNGHGARLVRGYNDPCSKELGPLVPCKPKKLSPSLGTL